MISKWTVAYMIASLAVLAAIYGAWRVDRRPRWILLVLQLSFAAVSAVLVWSVLVCSRLPFLDRVPRPASFTEWNLCVAGSSIWAGAVAVFTLPFYALLLTWAAARSDRQSHNWRAVIAMSCILGLPVGGTLLFGYSAPFYGGLLPDLVRALPFAVCGWLATSIGLAIPRLMDRRRDAARGGVRGDSV